MKVSEVLSKCTIMSMLTTADKLTFLNNAYQDIKSMFSVPPVMLHLMYSGELDYASITLENVPLVNSNGDIYVIKEIVEIFGETLLTSTPSNYEDNENIEVYGELEIPNASGEYIIDNNKLYFSNTVNIICYLYPSIVRGFDYVDASMLEEEINPILILPLLSQVHNLYYQSILAESSANIYRDITHRLCNLHNSNIYNKRITDYIPLNKDSSTGGIVSYDL